MSPFFESHRASGEKPSANAVIFEHLYPGCRWKDLPKLKLFSLVMEFGMYGFFEDINARFGEACRQGIGFAERIDLPPNVDQYILSSLFHHVLPLQETAHPYLGDLLRRNERFGRIASQRIQWVSTDPRKNIFIYNFLENDPPGWMRNTATGKIIGVLDRYNLPSANILYREGQRLRQHVEEPELSIIGKQAIQEVPIF